MQAYSFHSGCWMRPPNYPSDVQIARLYIKVSAHFLVCLQCTVFAELIFSSSTFMVMMQWMLRLSWTRLHLFVSERVFVVHKWIPYSTVISARLHNMGGNNWFFYLWMARWRVHTPKGLPKGWLILSWEFAILKGKSIFRRISTFKHEGYLLWSNYISFLKTLHHVHDLGFLQKHHEVTLYTSSSEIYRP